MAIETILFDMDGVLLTGYHTDPDVYRQAAAATLADFGIEYEGNDPPPDLVGPDTVADVRATCDDLDVAAAPAWAYRERAATTLENEQIVAGDRTTFTDTAVLADLAEEYTLGVISNNRHGTVRFAADYFDWPVERVRGRFPTLEEFGHLKPDPRFLRSELRRIGVEDALFVGDRTTDVEAAHRAGIDAAFLCRDGDSPDDDPEPEFSIGSLDELPEILDAQ